MKILLFLILLTGNTFAGDMYLTCEDRNGDDFYTDYIMEGPAKVEFKDIDIWGTKYSYSVTATMGDTNTYIISKVLDTNTYNRRAIVYTVITNSWSDDIRISENISCALRD